MFRTIGCFVHIRCASALGVGHGNGEERVIDKWIAMHAECIAAYVQVTDAMGERLALAIVFSRDLPNYEPQIPVV